jgi:hypothetical protein
MTLNPREKASIIISHLISIYSKNMQEGKIPPNQSMIDFVLKNMPIAHKPELSIELIDDVFSFIGTQHMELS